MTLVLQLILGMVLGFGAMMIVPAPEGWELVVGAVGITAGVLLAAVIMRKRPTPMHGAAAASAAFAGALAIPLLPPMGFQAVLLPLVLSVAAFFAVTQFTHPQPEGKHENS